MVVGAASLAQRARLRSGTPLFASAARFASSRTFSVAASATPRAASVRTTLNYDSATFARASLAFPAQSTLLAGKPFGAAVAARSLSFWGSSSQSEPQQNASTFASEVQSKKEEALNAAEELKHSAESAAHDASSSVTDSFQSTQHSASDALSTLQSKATSLNSTLTEQFSNVDPSSASTVTEAFTGAMGVKAGELTELGLNHWVTPPGWITNLLETVGSTTGLPWWGTIALTTVALRLLISPIGVAGQKNAIRLGNIQPQLKRNMDDIKHYKAAGDQMQMQKAVMATQKLLRDSKANPLKSFVPMLVQFPLMFSFFLALERIAKSGADSFAHGGPFWTPDLTVPDPTWILPAVSTLATFAVAELGFKVGTTTQSDPAQSQMIKYVFRGFMPVLAWISTTFPSGVLVYWATTNLYSLAQLAVLQIPVVRQWVKFPKRINHPKNPYQEQGKSWMEKLKATRDQLSDSSAKSVKPVAGNSVADKIVSRSDALKEILDDKAAYEASAPAAETESAAAKRNRQRVLKARQRRARQ